MHLNTFLLHSLALSSASFKVEAVFSDFFLKTTSPNNDLNNKWLYAGNFTSGEVLHSLGVVNGPRSSDAVMCFRVHQYSDTYNLVSQSRNTEAALQTAKDGLMKLVLGHTIIDVNTPPQYITEWGVFNFDSQNNLIVKDGTNLATRRWVAYKEGNGGDYAVALYDGVTVPKVEIFNLTITAVDNQALRVNSGRCQYGNDW